MNLDWAQSADLGDMRPTGYLCTSLTAGGTSWDVARHGKVKHVRVSVSECLFNTNEVHIKRDKYIFYPPAKKDSILFHLSLFLPFCIAALGIDDKVNQSLHALSFLHIF